MSRGSIYGVAENAYNAKILEVVRSDVIGLRAHVMAMTYKRMRGAQAQRAEGVRQHWCVCVCVCVCVCGVVCVCVVTTHSMSDEAM